jgi:regulator of protease activity HflC (stomatin/prohibitin superfamily)
MTPALIALLVIAFVVIVVVAKSITIVPQAQAKVIERLGRYSRTLAPGLNVLVPFVDRVRATVDLREQVISFPPQPVITSDNLMVGIDTVVYFQVTDSRLAVYGIANYITGMEQLTTTTLRNVVGGLNLEEALTGRDGINSQLREVLDGTTGPWGLRVARVEIKAIDPPASIQDSMEKQMRADRDKRAIILTAEGQRQAAIATAEGQKASAILSAEGKKQAAILEAEAERQSRILRAEGEGRNWMDVPPSTNGGQAADDGLDTSHWFESQLPPAAEQPEAKIELSTIEEKSIPSLEMPHPPPLSQVTEQARKPSLPPDGQPPSEG